ncbi:rho GTPase-activating protein 190-like isoform X2 [Ornithodoros turicata]|uniref:rho GTPase-activating protein 190-like isoform X2 n=1 Tax=Ornithodoros turicata TaxID=34597 RepID=UPI0031394D2A
MTTRRSQGLGGGGTSGGSTDAAARTLCVAVVGLSGTEREKGATGVGKSCLCNRFVRPLADDYHTDHISVLSQTDFGGRVVNNDHFLYWGEVTKTSEEGAEFHFHVVEQTEFIDDSSFQPFKSGKTDPYIKRSTTTRLTSAEKLMYICKNQLGIEKEYEQKLFPDGRMGVDGFVCVFDVCQVPGRMIEKQVEFTAALLNALLRTRKPVILATTKGDEAVDAYIREAERLVARKDLKGQVPLVETSAHENINVENAFLLIAQMADKAARGGRGGVGRIAPFTEAVRARREALDQATEAFQSLVRTQVTDHRVVWSSVSKRLSQSPEFERYCGLFGRSAARTAFDRHVRRLREEHVGRRVRGYLRALPAALADLLPNLDGIGESDWTTVKDEILRNHPDFDHFFLEVPGSTTWQEAVDSPDQDNTEDGRIPFPLLELSEAENCFLEHRATLEAEQRRRELRDQFTQLLEETGYVTPGKTLGEVRVLFMGRECYEQLSEADLLEVYEEHQREITERARAQFQELLLEHAELFYEFANVGPGSVITQEDIAKITEALQEDSRYKTLDRLDQDRMLMLLRHLGFVHGPIREHCPANPNCMDNLIEKVIAQKAHRPSSWTRNNQWLLESENNQLNLVVLGTGGLADEVASAVRANCNDDTFELDKIQYSLDFRIIDGDVGLPQNSFRTTDFTPHGCFCVYSNHQSLEYVRDSLEKTLLSNLEQDDRLPFHGLPIVILFAADASINEKDLVFLREEGQNRAKSLQCPFVDVTTAGGGGGPGQRLDASRLLQAMSSLVESIQRRAGLLQIYHSLPEQAACPDLRVLMCMLCGDPYAAEHVLAPLLAHQCCLATGPHSLTLETYLGAEGSKRSVQVRVTSYHEATAYRDHLIHGFILVYSAKRRASLATLSAFSKNISNVPIQIVAVTESGSASAFFSSDLSQQLIRDGNALADVLQAHFMTTSSAAPQKTAIYTPFFKEVWERKPQIEKAFYMEDSDYSPEGRTPVPPPVPNRQESYNLCSGRGSVEDGGDSEGLYEQLPADGQRGCDGDESSSVGGAVPSLSPSDDSELYTSVFSQQENGTEHLVKPSQVKKRRSLQADLYRQSFPSTESLDRNKGAPPPPLLPPGRGGGPDLSFPPPAQLVTFGGGGGGGPTSSPPPTYFPPSRLPLLYATGRRNREESQLPARFGGLKKSSSLKGAGYAIPAAPPLVPTGRGTTSKGTSKRGPGGHRGIVGQEQGVEEPLEDASDSGTDDDDTLSSGLGGWTDNRMYGGSYQNRADEWNEGSGDLYHSERHKVAPPTKPKPSKPKPGKLNLKQFDHLTDAITRLNLGPHKQGSTLPKAGLHAPLATPESTDDYTQDGSGPVYAADGSDYAYAAVRGMLQEGKGHRVRSLARRHASRERFEKGSDSDSEWSSLERRQGCAVGRGARRPGTHRKARRKRGIPVAPPRIPSFEGGGGGGTPPAVPPLPPYPGGVMGLDHPMGTAVVGVLGGPPSEGSDLSEEEDDEEGVGGDPHYRAMHAAQQLQRSKHKHGQKRSFRLKRRKPPSLVPGSVVPPRVPLSSGIEHLVRYASADGGLFLPSSKPKLEQSLSCVAATDDGSSYDIAAATRLGGMLRNRAESEKSTRKKEERKKAREDEKLEKRRVKEEERQKRLTEKKKKQRSGAAGAKGQPGLEDFVQSDEVATPLFVDKCIRFIEEEGLDSEGIYRVPGNRAHVDLLFQKFDEDPSVSIRDLDIPVNAVATALKDFFSKRLPPLLSPAEMDQLTEIAGIQDRSCRLLALRELIKNLPPVNFEILKFVFHHFVKVAENCRLNSMDSKNLAICWWPTLLPLEFNDMGMFERVRPHLEDSVQTMIDQFRFLYCNQEEVLKV